jgi:Spy/CpxP family protein refolding chaperone
MRPVLPVLALLAVPVTVAAQAAPEAGGRRPRDEAFRMVDAYIVSNLQEGLGLSDEEFVKVLPLVKRLQTDRRALAQRRHQALQEMRRLFQSGGATEARVADLLKEMKAVEADEPQVLRRDREAIDGALRPVQQAKFRLLEAEVERKIRTLMTQIRAQGGGPRPRRKGQEPEEPPLQP